MAQAGEPLGAAPMVMTGEAQRVARLAGGALAVLAIGSFVGSSSALYLVNHHPLLLIALSPIGRHLLLVAPTVDPVVFVAVAVGRRTLFYLASFYLGRAFGPPGVLWIEARARRFATASSSMSSCIRPSKSLSGTILGPSEGALSGS